MHGDEDFSFKRPEVDSEYLLLSGIERSLSEEFWSAKSTIDPW
jgi:hypothetical protein